MYLPQQARGEAEREEVLLEVGKVLCKYSDVGFVALGADANARVECNVPGTTGGLAFDEADSAGSRLAAFLQQHGLYVPSTYQHTHSGQCWTWKHARGGTSRIDYIFLRSGCMQQNRTWVSQTFDPLTSNEDHYALAWHGDLSYGRPTEVRRQLAKPRYDRDKILSAGGSAIISQHVASFPQPSWHVHPDDHAEQLAQSLRDVLDEHFIKPPNGPRASYVSEHMCLPSPVD